MIQKMIFLLTIFLAAGSLFAQNLYTNSGFESGSTGWNVWPNTKDSGAAATGAVDTSGIAYEGKKCYKVTVTKTANDTVKGNWCVQLQDPNWIAKKGVNYHYSCYAKADSAGRIIHVAVQGDSVSKYNYRTGSDFTLDTIWTKCQISFLSDVAGADSLNFYIYCGRSTGIYYFDSMALDSVGFQEKIKNSTALSKISKMPNYKIQILPDCIRIAFKGKSLTPNKLTISNLEGRLLFSQEISALTQNFDMPKPASGTWVLNINSVKTVIQIP